MKRIIVKVQIPIMTNADECLALIYNKDKSVHFQTPFDENDLKFMGNEKKLFFYAELHQDHFKLGKQAPWQSW